MKNNNKQQVWIAIIYEKETGICDTVSAEAMGSTVQQRVLRHLFRTTAITDLPQRVGMNLTQLREKFSCKEILNS